MNIRKALVVEENHEVLKTIVSTLEDAQMAYTCASTQQQALDQLKSDQFSLAIVRGIGSNIRGTELCRAIRSNKTSEELSILIMLSEDQLASGAEALIAGANDLLIAPFEPRELRMRAKIVAPDQLRRFDESHTLATSGDGESNWFAPDFDPATHRISFGDQQSRVPIWESDPGTKKIALDEIITCPECGGIPTFRHGCGACGSAFVEKEVLIHHYACAHVAPEADFRTPSGLVCPKCRLTDLVAGSDFEQTDGCYRCLDCDAISVETQLIGHCLHCQHRFAASEGKVQSIYGYQTGQQRSVAAVPAPNYQLNGIDIPASL